MPRTSPKKKLLRKDKQKIDEERLAKCFCLPGCIIVLHHKVWCFIDPFLDVDGFNVALPIEYRGTSKKRAIADAYEWFETAPFGERVLWCRTKRYSPPSLTQRIVSEALGHDRSWIGHIERGISEPSVTSVVQLSLYFDVTSDFLLAIPN